MPANDEKRVALEFIRNVAMAKMKRANDLWSTVFHVAQDALDGHNLTIDQLRGEDNAS